MDFYEQYDKESLRRYLLLRGMKEGAFELMSEWLKKAACYGWNKCSTENRQGFIAWERKVLDCAVKNGDEGAKDLLVAIDRLSNEY